MIGQVLNVPVTDRIGIGKVSNVILSWHNPDSKLARLYYTVQVYK